MLGRMSLKGENLEGVFSEIGESMLFVKDGDVGNRVSLDEIFI